MTTKELQEGGGKIEVAKKMREQLGNAAIQYVGPLQEVIAHPAFKSLEQATQDFYTQEITSIKELLSRPVPE